MSDATDAIMDSGGSKYPAFDFKQIGDKVVGTIIETPKSVTMKNKFTSQDETKIPLALSADNDQGGVTVWIRTEPSSFLASAFKAALTADDVPKGTKLIVGTKVSVEFSGTEDTGKGNPAKTFTVKVKPAPAEAPGEEVF